MTCIEFSTEALTTYLVDVVNKKIKTVQVKGELKTDPQWVSYEELIGSGKIDTPMKIVWSLGENPFILETSNITNLKFV